jgi:hypothetical protein
MWRRSTYPNVMLDPPDEADRVTLEVMLSEHVGTQIARRTTLLSLDIVVCTHGNGGVPTAHPTAGSDRLGAVSSHRRPCSNR